MSTLSTFIQHSFVSPRHSNQRRKRNKGNPNWKRKSKTVTIFRCHDTIHRKPLRHYYKITAAAAAAKSLQWCLTLCDPPDSSPPGSSVPGILQARILEWVAIPSPMHACMLSCFSRVRLCVTPQTAAHQAPLSTGFSRQEYWSGLPFTKLLELTKELGKVAGYKSNTQKSILFVYTNNESSEREIQEIMPSTITSERIYT